MALYLGNKRVHMNGVYSIQNNVYPIIDVSDADELTTMLTADNLGNIYRYTGETNETYTNGDLYEVIAI